MPSEAESHHSNVSLHLNKTTGQCEDNSMTSILSPAEITGKQNLQEINAETTEVSSTTTIEEKKSVEIGEKPELCRQGNNHDFTIKETKMNIDYSIDLFHSSQSVFTKADKGLQTCKALAAYLQERALIGDAYGKGLIKVSKNTDPEEWAVGLRTSWKTIRKCFSEQGHLHTSFASKISSTFGSSMSAFAHQQEIQINQLIREGHNIQKQHQHTKLVHTKMKQKYQKHCDDAEAAINNLKQTAEESLDTQEKTSLGPTQLFTKVWDTTGFLAKPSIEKLRIKVDSCLDDVMQSKKEYEENILLYNKQREKTVKQRKENLHAFQLTEEQRLKYIKDILLRYDESYRNLVQQDEEILIKLKEAVSTIETSNDAISYFPKLSSNEDESSKTIDSIVEKASLVADEGRKTTQLICSSLVESISVEETYAKNLNRLIQSHSQSLGFSNATTIAMENEGTTLKKAWTSIIYQTERTAKTHLELASVTAEPLCLNIASMKEQHEAVKKQHLSSFTSIRRELSNLYSAEAKAHQRLEDKSRELQAGMAALSQARKEKINGMSDTESSSSGAMLQQFGLVNAPFQRIPKLEQKIQQLSEERAELEQSCSSLLDKRKHLENKHLMEAIRVTQALQKNELFRLEVLKISFLGLVRAYENILMETKINCDLTFNAIDGINHINDINEYVNKNRGQFTNMKLLTMDIHPSALLHSALVRKYGQLETFEMVSSSSTILSPSICPSPSISLSPSAPPVSLRLPAEMLFSPEQEEVGINRMTETEGMSPLSIGETTSDSIHTLNDNELRNSVFQQFPLKSNLSLNDSTSNTETSNSPKDEISDQVDGNSNIGLRRRSKIIEDRRQSTEDLSKDYDIRKDTNPSETSDFQKRFNLPVKEQLVVSFACAYYQSNFPAHGRLYLTQNYICFAGWRETQLMLAVENVSSVEKRNTALVVPNAIEIITDNDTKHFFAAFLYRDDCYATIMQLREIKKKMAELLDPAASKSFSEEIPLEANLEAISGYNVIFKTIYPVKVEDVYQLVWSLNSTLYDDFLREAGETELELSQWKEGQEDYSPIGQKEIFQSTRNISFQHNKKYIIGPSTVPTRQVQRLRYQNDCLVVHFTSNVFDVPYYDYFRVETRYVFSKASSTACHMQIAIQVFFVKNTWLKKQIEGSTMSEAKASALQWDIYLKKKLPQFALPVNTPTISTDNLISTHSGKDEGKKDIFEMHELLKTIKSIVSSFNWKSCLLMGGFLCAFAFIIILYRICVSLEELQQISLNALAQQHEQLLRLQRILEKMPDRH